MYEKKYICHGCVGDEYIQKIIKKDGSTEGKCSYCHGRKKTIPISELAERMHTVFTRFYRASANGELYPGYSFGSSAEDVIAECLNVDEDIPADIHDALKDIYNHPYDGDVYCDEYEYKAYLPSTDTFDSKWQEIKRSLQSEARFFNQKVKKFFEEIFHQIDNLHTTDNQQAVSIIGTEQGIFRARVFENYSKVEEALEQPEKHLGPPPQQLATSGRMNAQGIQAFYGAFSHDIAISEVRPAVGNHVVVAEFNPLKPLRVLNISLLELLRPDSGSYFDPVYGDQLAKTSFIRTLSRKLTLPVSGERTESEYLITQAVAEYLSVLREPAIDGIIFQSTQVALNNKNDRRTDLSQHNIVLFSKSAKVQDGDLSNLKYVVNLIEEDYDDEASWTWLEPRIQLLLPSNNKSYQLSHTPTSTDYSLKLNTSKMVLHEIRGVVFQNEPYEITKGPDILPNSDGEL